MGRLEEQNTTKKTFGENIFPLSTPAQRAGVAYSLASILPAVFGFVFLIVCIACKVDLKSAESQDWYLYCAFLISQIAFVCITLFLFPRTGKTVTLAWKEQRCAPKYYVIALLMQVGLFSLTWLNGMFLEFLGRYGYGGAEVCIPSLDGIGFVGVLVVVALLPALLEEIVFRGFVLNGLKSAFGETATVFLCGALFALYHQNPTQTLYQFCCGVAFAFVAVRAGSVLPTILAHFFNNALIIVLEKYPAQWINSATFMVISACCLVGAIVWLVLCKRGKTQRDKTHRKDFFVCASLGIVVCLISWISVLVQRG